MGAIQVAPTCKLTWVLCVYFIFILGTFCTFQQHVYTANSMLKEDLSLFTKMIENASTYDCAGDVGGTQGFFGGVLYLTAKDKAKLEQHFADRAGIRASVLSMLDEAAGAILPTEDSAEDLVSLTKDGCFSIKQDVGIDIGDGAANTDGDEGAAVGEGYSDMPYADIVTLFSAEEDALRLSCVSLAAEQLKHILELGSCSCWIVRIVSCMYA